MTGKDAHGEAVADEAHVPQELLDLLASAAASKTVVRKRRHASSATDGSVDPTTAPDEEHTTSHVCAMREEDNEISAANIARRAPSPDTTESAVVGEELLRKLGIDSGGESTPQD